MWAENSIFYHIYPLGFCKNSGIQKVKDIIEHIKYVGADAIYFGPVFQSTNHGYDTADYFWIDSRLGTNEDFKDVCETLHRNGIKIVLDGVFNHVGRDFWAFKDVLQNRENSKYCDWFFIDWSGNNRYNDGFRYLDWEGCDDLVKLNLKNKEVRTHLFDAIKSWVGNFDIDGLRLDVAYCLDKDFIKELHNFAKSLKNDFWLMGETVHGNYNKWMNDRMLDSVTNYECYKGLYSSCNDKNLFEIAHSLKRQDTLYGGKYMYNFLDNHDVNRISSSLKDKRDLKAVYAMLYTMPGIPSIYYGSEIGIEGDKDKFGDDVLRPCLDNLYGNDLTDYINKLSNIRRNNPVMISGKYRELELSSENFVFSRENDNSKAVCAVNISDNDYTAYVDDIEIKIPPKSAKILVDGCVVL